MLRLWAGSADYHVDVRCSREIFKQLSQNYLKFRNTARYCLGNLAGFDADRPVPPAEMLELDRWAVTKLNSLIRAVADAYYNYEFHAVCHICHPCPDRRSMAQILGHRQRGAEHRLEDADSRRNQAGEHP